MKTITRLGLAGALAGMVAFGGCSTADSMMGRNQQVWTMSAEKAMPSVVGKVQVATGEKGNRDLKVEASHLAKPESKFEGASTYVVWLKPSDGNPVNIGVLQPDKNENAKLETTTSFTSFEIMVTAEESPQPTTPSHHEVLNATVHVAT
jgi:anti-sigma-K factor RskA